MKKLKGWVFSILSISRQYQETSKNSWIFLWQRIFRMPDNNERNISVIGYFAEASVKQEQILRKLNRGKACQYKQTNRLITQKTFTSHPLCFYYVWFFSGLFISVPLYNVSFNLNESLKGPWWPSKSPRNSKTVLKWVMVAAVRFILQATSSLWDCVEYFLAGTGDEERASGQCTEEDYVRRITLR